MYQNFFLSTVDSYTIQTQLYPSDRFREEYLIRDESRRTLGGELNDYLIAGESIRYTLPLTWVSSSDRAQLQSWWKNQTSLIFTLNNSTPDLKTVYVKINNEDKLLANVHDGNSDKFQGNVFLKSVKSSYFGETPVIDNLRKTPVKLPGGPFLLDHAVWGKLDQTYNVLG